MDEGQCEECESLHCTLILLGKRSKESAMVPLMCAIQILHHHKSECQRLVVILSFLWQQHSGGAFQAQWDNEWS